jgi:hypothetical protein
VKRTLSQAQVAERKSSRLSTAIQGVLDDFIRSTFVGELDSNFYSKKPLFL